jgi:hypothetical protein
MVNEKVNDLFVKMIVKLLVRQTNVTFYVFKVIHTMALKATWNHKNATSQNVWYFPPSFAVSIS